MGVVLLDRTGASWAEFRRHLVAAIRQRPRSPRESAATAYYAAWLDALEALLAERGLLGRQAQPAPVRLIFDEADVVRARIGIRAPIARPNPTRRGPKR